jgi:hypothetical protein
MNFIQWFISTNKLSNALLIALAIWVIIHLISILKDGYYISIEPHKWIAWGELVLMVSIITLGIWRLL